MKSSLIAATVLVLATTIPAIAADKGAKKAKNADQPAPEFEGHHPLFLKFQNFTRAKTAIEEGKDSSTAIEELRKATAPMMNDVKRGNYIMDMRRFADQVVRHLEAGDIDNAIKATTRAAQVANPGK